MDEPDFAAELRGSDEEEMNVREAGWVPAVVMGIILSAANIWLARSVNQTDTTATSLATLTERVSTLSAQVTKLTEQPYVRREEYLGVLGGIENRLAGIEQRISNVERAALERRNRER